MRSTRIVNLRKSLTEEEINKVIVLVDANEVKSFSELEFNESSGSFTEKARLELKYS